MDLLTDGTPAHRDTQNPRRLALTDPLIQLEAIRRIVQAAGLAGVDLVGDVAGLATARMLSVDQPSDLRRCPGEKE